MSQKNINKLFAIVLAILVLCVTLLRINEQKRVEYYICYNQLASTIQSPNEEDIMRIKEICHERN